MNGRLLQFIHNLPPELTGLSQWCISMPDKQPVYISAKGIRRASSTNSDTWMSFQAAVEAASWLNTPGALEGNDAVWQQLRDVDWEGERGEFGVGLMLSEYDPYVVVDMDVKNAQNLPDEPEKWTRPEVIKMYQDIVEYFDSYTELSPGGFGLHVIVKGQLGKGSRRDGVEMYDRWRFMRCTGNLVVPKLPAGDVQDRIDTLNKHLQQGRQDRDVELVEGLPQRYEDSELYEIASTADNANKFNMLWEYDGSSWPWNGYPSQSEADLALMSMLTFYSDNNEQCRRLFRMSGLGKREKARKDNRHINLILRLIRARQANAANIDAYVAELARNNAQASATPLPIAAPPPTAPQGEYSPTVTYTAPQALEPGQGLPWPPGFAGDIAKFMYASSKRPVPEVAIVATIGLLAGVLGKAYNIPQSGLNMYVTLVARSGVGKEGMHSGVSTVMRSIMDQVPAAMGFVSFDEFASGQALNKVVGEHPCFVNVSGEWGRRLKRMANDERDAAMMSLRTSMTNLYQKSAHGSIVGGMSYSNKDNNTLAVSGVAYSMIGESTPATFYESLTQSMMEDGFMSRFLVIEYNGNRPELNENEVQPSAEFKDRLAMVAAQALKLISQHTVQQVAFSPEAKEVLDGFNKLCDRKIDETDNESRRQMWNRAHLKTLRLAALLAAADNHLNPVVYLHHAQWALLVVERDVQLISTKLRDGDIGSGDQVQMTKLVSVVRSYLDSETAKKSNVNRDMHRDGVVTRSYLQTRVSRQSAFYKHSLGINHALNGAIRALEDNGCLSEVSRKEMHDNYKFTGKAYRILHLPEME